MFTTLLTCLCIAGATAEIPFERIDYNGDGVIGSPELVILLNNWGRDPAESEQATWADINGDGGINYDDLVLVLSNWTYVEQG